MFHAWQVPVTRYQYRGNRIPTPWTRHPNGLTPDGEPDAQEWARRNPTAIKVWRDAWDRFTPFLEFPPEVRKVIYTTNAIESLNYQLRKVTKNRGHFPTDDATVKLLWLAICDIEDKRARERENEKGQPKDERKAPGRLIEGQMTTNWRRALEQLFLAYPERVQPRTQQ